MPFVLPKECECGLCVCECVWCVCVCVCVSSLPKTYRVGEPKPGSASQTLLIPSRLSPDPQGLKGHLGVFVSCCYNVLILKSPLEAQLMMWHPGVVLSPQTALVMVETTTVLASGDDLLLLFFCGNL